MDYINTVQIGGYINFSLFEPKLPVDEVGAGYKRIASELEIKPNDSGAPF